jgi:hypothetical protein
MKNSPWSVIILVYVNIYIEALVRSCLYVFTRIIFKFVFAYSDIHFFVFL